MSGKSFAVLLASLLAIGVALAIALSNERPDTIGTPFESIQAHRATWLSRRPSAYAVTISRRCFCPLWSVRVKVSGGDVESVKFLASPGEFSDFADRRYPRDIDSLFKVVDDAYASKAYKVEIAFDEALGYPIKVFIDRNRDTVDDEQWFELENFEAS